MKRLFFVIAFIFLLLPFNVFASILLKLDTTGNPQTTEYAIYEQTQGKWVQQSGSLGTDPFWQSYEGWGGDNGFDVFVDFDQEFLFQVKARSVGKDETAFSPEVPAFNVRGPKDLPTDFITSFGLVNGVSESIFEQNQNEEVSEQEQVIASIWGNVFGNKVNTILLSLTFVMLIQLFVVSRRHATKREEKTKSIMPIKMLSLILMLATISHFVFTGSVSQTFATWSVPEDRLFSSESILAKQGDILTYMVLLKNNESKRQNIEVTNVVPEGTTYIKGSLAFGNQLQTDEKGDDFGYFEEEANTAFFNFSEMAENEEIRVYFSVKVN